jgi:hypothetical protein
MKSPLSCQGEKVYADSRCRNQLNNLDPERVTHNQSSATLEYGQLAKNRQCTYRTFQLH